MRPNAEEIVRGVQASLLQIVLPEIQTEYTRTTVTLIYVLLGIVANGLDGGYERLLADNAALRELSARAVDALGPGGLADQLLAFAAPEPSLRLSELSRVNMTLAAALARVATFAAPELRSEIIDYLRADAEARSLSLMGPRADG